MSHKAGCLTNGKTSAPWQARTKSWRTRCINISTLIALCLRHTASWSKSPLRPRTPHGRALSDVTGRFIAAGVSGGILITRVSTSTFCFTSTEARWLIRDGDGGWRGRKTRLDRGYRPKKTGETIDRRQNNGSVMAVSPRHCPATSAPLGQSHKDNVRCTAVEEQLEAKAVQLSQPSSTALLMISSGVT